MRLTGDNVTRLIMGHIRANGFEADYVAGKIINERVWKKISYGMSESQLHNLIDVTIQTYKAELKIKEYKTDFDDLLK